MTLDDRDYMRERGEEGLQDDDAYRAAPKGAWPHDPDSDAADHYSGPTRRSGKFVSFIVGSVFGFLLACLFAILGVKAFGWGLTAMIPIAKHFI
ncbi:hypothetical protein [Pseudomonas sp. 2FE]|uniref:hypothetical protein n=1 Tax=Pseudomonas sp. 2FE TaxID=2502190 RepID=UPI0010F668F2|nr:hypothetical protein [Pseudomonas sp. 2FE]